MTKFVKNDAIFLDIEFLARHDLSISDKKTAYVWKILYTEHRLLDIYKLKRHHAANTIIDYHRFVFLFFYIFP